MKTPKEILLQRHEGIESKLNAVRQNALATVNRPTWAQSWREFILSIRWHLAGMGVIWLAVFLLNIDSAAGSGFGTAVATAKYTTQSTRLILTALINNRRELMELTEAPVPGEPAILPPRRSEIQSKVVYV